MPNNIGELWSAAELANKICEDESCNKGLRINICYFMYKLFHFSRIWALIKSFKWEFQLKYYIIKCNGNHIIVILANSIATLRLLIESIIPIMTQYKLGL